MRVGGTGSRLVAATGAAGACEVGVLGENGLVQLTQLGSRLEPELLDQQLARAPVDLERLGLAATAVERQHQLALKPLAQRFLHDRRLQLADQVVVSANGKLRLDPSLESNQPPLLEPSGLGLDEGLVGHIGKRRPAPQPERLPKRGRGPLRIPPSRARPRASSDSK